ncbi:MAG: Crp/Fnr family transcriptional regulator, partial [Chthoniobacterales bacterium]
MAVTPKVAIPPKSEGEVCGPVQLEQLLQVPLFQGLTVKAAKKLCSLLVSREFKAPTRLFNAGDSGDAMYLIEHGRVRITVMDADGREVTLTEMHAGEFFGEMALIDGHERSAGALVLEDTRLAVLSRDD